MEFPKEILRLALENEEEIYTTTTSLNFRTMTYRCKFFVFVDGKLKNITKELASLIGCSYTYTRGMTLIKGNRPYWAITEAYKKIKKENPNINLTYI